MTVETRSYSKLRVCKNVSSGARIYYSSENTVNVLPTWGEEASEERRTEDFVFPSAGLSSCCDVRQVGSGTVVQKVFSEMCPQLVSASV